MKKDVKIIDKGWYDERGGHHDCVLSVDGVETAFVFAIAMGWVDAEWVEKECGAPEGVQNV